MSTVSKEKLEVVEFSVSEVESLSAPEVFRVLEFNIELELGSTNVSEVEGDEFVTHTGPASAWVSGSGIGCKDWQKFEGLISVVGAVLTVPDRL